MLLDVITRLSADTGFDLTQQRASLVQIANRAAKEMHKELECNKMYREVTLVVPPDKVVSIPSFVGELRGMRMHTNELPFNMHSIAMPRYVNTTLEHKFKNWRDLGESAVHTLPSTVGPLSFTYANAVTAPVTVVISGQTNKANKAEESLLLNVTPKATTNLFGPHIDSIACFAKRDADIVIKDAAGIEIAVLYNNFSKTRYKLVDVSQVFWTLDTTDGSSLIDVLYKVPATELLRDSDSFYAGDDYDEAWYNMSMWVYLQPLENRLQEAALFKQAATAFITAAKESGEQGIMKRLAFGRNKYFGIFRKYRYFPGSVTNVDSNVQS